MNKLPRYILGISIVGFIWLLLPQHIFAADQRCWRKDACENFLKAPPYSMTAEEVKNGIFQHDFFRHLLRIMPPYPTTDYVGGLVGIFKI